MDATFPNITIPDISREKLLPHLSKEDIKLHSMCNGNAIFKSTMLYPMIDKINFKYDVVVTIPLKDEIFNTDNTVQSINPTKALQSVQFKFASFEIEISVKCVDNGYIFL